MVVMQHVEYDKGKYRICFSQQIRVFLKKLVLPEMLQKWNKKGATMLFHYWLLLIMKCFWIPTSHDLSKIIQQVNKSNLLTVLSKCMVADKMVYQISSEKKWTRDIHYLEVM